MNQENNARLFQLLADRTGQVVFIYRIEAKRFSFMNPAFEQVWQQSRTHFYADPAALMDTVHPEDKTYVAQSYQEVVQGKEKKDLEFRIILPDESIRWLCLTPYLFTEGGESFLAGFAQDINQQKQFSDTMKGLHARKNSVMEILSHDLASPMNTITGLSDLIASKTKQYENQDLNEIVALIQDSCRGGVRLIREFVNQEFLESTGQALIKQRVNIVAKLAEVMNEYKRSQESISKTFHLVTSHPQIYVSLDEFKFMQVINNLFSNAIKFTHDGGEITARIDEQEDSVLVTITDNGVGIPDDLQAGLFEKFTKARRPGLQGEPSVGLGMSIVKMIVEWHQGKIWFTSQENIGTCFFIKLPKE